MAESKVAVDPLNKELELAMEISNAGRKEAVDLSKAESEVAANLNMAQSELAVDLNKTEPETAMDLSTGESEVVVDLKKEKSEWAIDLNMAQLNVSVEFYKTESETAVEMNKTTPEVEVEVEMEVDSQKPSSIVGKHVRMAEPEVTVCPNKQSKPEVAVCLFNASKSYGKVSVLNNLNMVVRKGSIYGLLGPSGCGKTTLLRCVVGLLDLNEGEVRVFGGKPRTKGSGVPGPRIGYMPQEVALVAEFDVKGAIFYFGWLFGMSNFEIADRYQFLSTLLQLPPGNQLIKDLSGGQQRRVSFAAALVQRPELLILDEPTVGLDPVLRQTIWDYMVEISRDQNTTIIITTHYIEEAKQANTIGLLRGGTLLAESTPNQLLAQHNTTSLEQVFLTLSQQQSADDVTQQPTTIQEQQNSVQAGSHFEADQNIEDTQQGFPLFDFNSPPPHAPLYRKSYLIPMKALLFKNFTRIFNTYGGLFFLFVFPLLEVLIFFLAIGRDPTKIPIGIVNDELGDCSALSVEQLELQSGIRLDEENDECVLFGLSCLLIDKLYDDTTVHMYYDDVESAKAAALKGHTAGTIHIPGNFSFFLQQKVRDGKDATNESLYNSMVPIWLDMSQYSSLHLRKHLFDGYFQFSDMLTTDCQKSIKLGRVPIKFEDPVYGSKNPVYTYFLAPAILVSMMFFLCTTLTIAVVSVDMAEKSWDRTLVAGVTSTEIVISHLLTHSLCGLIKMAEMLCLGFFVFDMHCHGNMADVLALMFLQGMGGIVFGMFLSVATNDLTSAAFIGMGSLLPFIFLSGMLWPLEGMSIYLRVLSECLPNTWATTALRNILDRGWGVAHPQVYPGFLITGAWIVGLSGLSAGLLKFRE